MSHVMKNSYMLLVNVYNVFLTSSTCALSALWKFIETLRRVYIIRYGRSTYISYSK